MRGDRVVPLEVPRIDGYRVWLGRTLLHARFAGTPAQARAQGRPWHVVAPSPAELIREAGRRPRQEERAQW
jgi:hypothetical protein